MRTSRRSELTEAIRETVAAFCAAGRRFWNRDIVDTVIEQNGDLFADLGRQLAREKLFDLTRRVMKTAAEVTEAEARLQLGLDLPEFEMPNLIAVPVDILNPLNGDCEWVPVMHATVADLDSNLRMLDVQIAADQRRRRHIAMLRQRVVAVVGEKTELTVAEAAALAREMQSA
ncbi:MAG TPA: hypothetical protein VE999_13625 [Gemmataceae bacterium]|nr:hypothetical protein [Bryobacteraceae bacterium]HZV06112.1 hypothetical protein [Gemmataceae bacterium]